MYRGRYQNMKLLVPLFLIVLLCDLVVLVGAGLTG